MNITKLQLKQLIKEELRAIHEGVPDPVFVAGRTPHMPVPPGVIKLDWLALSDKAQELWYVYAAKIDRDYPPSAAKTLMLIFIREHPHAALEMELQHSNDTMFRYARSKNLNLLFEPPPRGRRGAAEAQLDADVAAGLDTLEQLQAEEGLK